MDSKNLNKKYKKRNNSSQRSASLPLGRRATQWESYGVKTHLMEIQSKVGEVFNQVEQTDKIRRNTGVSLIKQVRKLKTSAERQRKLFMKRESNTMLELMKIKNELNRQKESSEDKISSLERRNVELVQKLWYSENNLIHISNEYKRTPTKLQLQVFLCEEETKKCQEELQRKTYEFDALRSELFEEKEEHDEAKIKIKTLECELSLYDERTDIPVIAKLPLSNLSDLEREISRLNTENQNLQENMNSRLERNGKDLADAILALKAQIRQLEQENEKNLENATAAHTNTAIIEDILETEINTLRSQLTSAELKIKTTEDTQKVFRTVCYSILGYRIDQVSNAIYRVTSKFAANQNEFIDFYVTELRGIVMLVSDYTRNSLADLIQSYVSLDINSYPVFLSTLTQRVFRKFLYTQRDCPLQLSSFLSFISFT